METNFSLREFNTFGFDVKAKYFQELKTIDDIHKLIYNPEFEQCRDKMHRVLILSGGSNILFTDDFYDGFVVYPNLKGIETLEETEETVKIRCYCGEVWKDFVDYTVSKGLYGLENLADIPGKVGAAPVQNIGAYGAEVKDTVYQVHAISLLNERTKAFDKEECKFTYRGSVFKEYLQSNNIVSPFLIYAVDFEFKKHGELKLEYGNIRNYLADRDITNPTIQDVASVVKAIRAEKLPEVGVVGSAGSFFQNTLISKKEYLKLQEIYPEIPYYTTDEFTVKIPTGWLIDKAGWKGYRENHVGVWDKQALVLVHYGGGKPQEILDLMQKIQDSVREKFRIKIRPEVNIISSTLQ